MKEVTMFQARLLHGPVGLPIEDQDWTDFGEPGSDFDAVLNEARQSIEFDEPCMLVIAEIKTRYHVTPPVVV